jgi:predicted methyltransferase
LNTAAISTRLWRKAKAVIGATPALASLAAAKRAYLAAAAGICIAALTACQTAPPSAPAAAVAPDYSAAYAAAIANPGRSAEDRSTDTTRKPLDLLRFAKARPGMNAMDMAAGDGYTARLLALVAGPTGSVWAQIPMPRPRLETRMAAQPLANLSVNVRSFEDPYPADAPKLDLVTLVLSYHDIAYAPLDRSKMIRQLFAAIKPGGTMVLVDHAAKAGTGLQDAKTLHRIDEAQVVQDFTAAGFKLEEAGSFLRNPADPREKAFFDARELTTDKFALRFVRP